MNARIANIAALILNLAIGVMALYGAVVSYSHCGIKTFQYYTVLSNLFGAVACLLVAGFQIAGKVPSWAYYVQYAASVCLTVTFLVVLFVLAPGAGEHGYKTMLLKEDMLYHHLLCPILILVSVILFERPELPVHCAFYAMLPTFVYGTVTLILNILRKLDGPYPFLHVYEQPVYMSVIWFIAIIGGSYLLALGIRALATL